MYGLPQSAVADDGRRGVGLRLARRAIGEADRLVAMRDMLQFEDELWFHQLSQHFATLDSASTFTPKNEDERRQVSSAMKTAAYQILELINEKLPDNIEPGEA